jgi:predicted esterase
MALIEQTIAATIHGRYLIEPAAARGAPMLAGFHGYAEPAAVHLARLRAIPGSEVWTAVSIQGLHRFYQRRTGDVVASWMTSQDRELAIGDNRAYVASAIEQAWRAQHCAQGVLFAGFSQGVAMAFRAVSAIPQPVLGVVAVGGDVPPELDSDTLRVIGHVLLMRGARDQFYSLDKWQDDQRRLRDAGVQVAGVEFDGGHEWSAPVLDAASKFLESRRR